MANLNLVTGAAGRVGAIGRTVTELLLKQGKEVQLLRRLIEFDTAHPAVSGLTEFAAEEGK